jgi:hypothetical protein
VANSEHLRRLKRGVDFWNQWRKGNMSVLPELSGAELSLRNLAGINLDGADLTRGNLSRAALNKATFRNAKLNRADMLNARLVDANCFGASLSSANLSGADLSGANLGHAELFGANLTGAILTNTDFNQAKVGVTIFGNVDLSQARNLGTLRHRGPSTVGVDTLYHFGGETPERVLRRGGLPISFLRGCGLPETLIDYLPSPFNEAVQFCSCFISYSHSDKPFARRLYDGLQGRGIRCWLDEHQMLPGHDIYEEVDRGIKFWDKVLLCASQHSLTSWWVDDEISRAFDKEQRLMREREEKVLALIPLNLDGYLFSGKWKSAKRNQVKQRLAADFTGWQADSGKFAREFERVVKALRTDSGREEPPTSKL